MHDKLNKTLLSATSIFQFVKGRTEGTAVLVSLVIAGSMTSRAEKWSLQMRYFIYSPVAGFYRRLYLSSYLSQAFDLQDILYIIIILVALRSNIQVPGHGVLYIPVSHRMMSELILLERAAVIS